MSYETTDSSTSFQGIDEGPDGLKLISDIIREKMGIDVSVLIGANIASEVAAEKFCETTIGEAQRVPGDTGSLDTRSLDTHPSLLHVSSHPSAFFHPLSALVLGAQGIICAKHMLYQ